MISMAESGSGIAAPILAGALIGIVGFERLWVIFAIDLVTFVIALGALVIVTIPNPPQVESGTSESLFRQSMFGFRYIWQHRPLFDLQMVFFASNLIASLCFTILPALVLARTGNNATVLATVAVCLCRWRSHRRCGADGVGRAQTQGGRRSSRHGVRLPARNLVLGLGRSLPVWMAGPFLMMVFLPILNGSNQAIWQSKVPPALQGRVFSVRRIIAQVIGPHRHACLGTAGRQGIRTRDDDWRWSRAPVGMGHGVRCGGRNLADVRVGRPGRSFVGLEDIWSRASGTSSGSSRIMTRRRRSLPSVIPSQVGIQPCPCYDELNHGALV